MPRPLNLEVIAAPTVEAVTLAEVKAHLRLEVGQTDEDALLTGLIGAAGRQAERFTGRALMTQSYSLWLDRWPLSQDDRLHEGWREGAFAESPRRPIEIPRPPLQSVAFVKTYDDDDSTTVFPASHYLVDTSAEPGRLVLRRGAALPTSTRAAKGVEIRFTAGYGGSGSSLPEDLRQGMLLLIAHLYEHRGDDPAAAATASGAERLWRPYRVLRL